jgi:hypothetical protein
MRPIRPVAMLLCVLACAACPAKVATVEVAPAKMVFDSDLATKNLTVVLKDDDGQLIEEPRPMTFTSQDFNVVKVDATGVVKPMGSGATSIKVTVEEQTGVAAVEVVLLKRIQLQTPALVLVAGTPSEALRLNYMNERGEALEVDLVKRPAWKAEWKTADPAVATVTDAGVVTGVSAGSTAVLVTVGDLKAEMKLTINPLPEPEPAPVPEVVPTKKKTR